jgi:bZIP transcription factor
MTTATGSTMPPLDMSAALQAAVAAAAEIARVGFPDGSGAVFSTAAPAVETASPPALDNEESPKRHHVVAPQPEIHLVPYQHPILPEIRPAGSSSPASFTSSQCTGQDAAGDKQHSYNDMPPLSGGEEDAAGEKTFEDESEEDAAKRLARSRERNREHARRTRLRKKAQLEALQSRVRGLEAEKKALKQKIEECSIASILINLADTSQDEPQPATDETTNLLDATIQKQENSANTDAKIHLLTAGKRKRFASVDTSEENRVPQTLKLKIDGQTKLIGPKSHINWKSGVYSDENGAQRQLTSEQLEGLR